MKTKSKSKYKNEAYKAIHSAVEGMYRSKTIDKATMKHFDETCLVAAEEFLQRHKSKDLVRKINEALSNQSSREDKQWLTAAKRKHQQIMDYKY